MAEVSTAEMLAAIEDLVRAANAMLRHDQQLTPTHGAQVRAELRVYRAIRKALRKREPSNG